DREYYLVLRNLGLRFHAAMSGQAAAKSIFALLDTPDPDVTKPGHIVKSIKPIANTREPIVFESVSFRYPERESEAVSQVSFRLQPGTLTALVGPSGAGKTTISQLLLRFIHPHSGIIRVGETPIDEIPLDLWRTQTAWVSQQPYLFHQSIAENLRLGKPGAGAADLRQALEWAELWDWVATLPDGLDTIVGEQGGRLSGGQAQRLALARAYLRDAPLLILDEPTAHLDPDLEDKLSATTRRLCTGRTVLMIAHRLTSIKTADQVLLLENGHLTATGTHAELAINSAAYSHLLSVFQGGKG
ncbi:MAG TPA: ATP-binding cassette domain-containing protein, partial [Longilinea sp.]|nr:ATP-binding cassette domain-containing protein [Longilinea sp.]